MTGEAAHPAALMAEVHRWMVLPTIWGQSDCMLCLADWHQRVHGVDVAHDIRGLYDDMVSCERLTGFMRAPLTTTRRFFEDRGGLGPRSGAPALGDIALLDIVTEGRRQAVGGLWIGGGWLSKGQPGGATMLSPRAIIATLGLWDMRYAPA